jgi:putative hydrolase of the HAD superfamily
MALGMLRRPQTPTKRAHMTLCDRKILTFDVMGTLIDYETGVLNYLRPIVKKAELAIDDAAILSSYGRAEDAQHKLTPGIPFTNMQATIYRSIAADLGLPTAVAHEEGLRLSMEHWPAFPDSVAALKQLRTRFRLVAMTNADNWAVSHFSKTLEDPFDDTVTAEDVETCKPDPQVFAYTRGRNSAHGYRIKDYLHVAQSQFHDIGIAKRLGYDVCWIERRQGQTGFGASPSVSELTIPEYHFATLAQLVDAVESGK